MNRIFDFLKKNIEWVLFITLGMTIASPFIFTRSWTNIDFTQTGAIGDTIGGLTAPFLNFLSIILLYLTLREQTQTSRKQQDFDATSRLLSSVKSDFDNIYLHLNSGKSYTGTNALFEMRSILISTSDISLFLDEASLRTFNLSLMFLTGNIGRLLKRNFASTTDLDDKKEIYDVLNNFRSPITMITQSCAQYYSKRLQINNGQSITELDKIVGIINLVKIPLDGEYEKYKIA